MYLYYLVINSHTTKGVVNHYLCVVYQYRSSSKQGKGMQCAVPTKADTPHGNFEMLSLINELDLCGLFFTNWWPEIDDFSV